MKKRCSRCYGRMQYQIQIEDGIQYILSECSCATERHYDFSEIEFFTEEEAREFLTVDEMTI